MAVPFRAFLAFPVPILTAFAFDHRGGRIVIREVVNLEAARDFLPEPGGHERVSDGRRFGEMWEAPDRRHREKSVGQMAIRPHEAEGVERQGEAGPIRPDLLARGQDLWVIDEFVLE